VPSPIRLSTSSADSTTGSSPFWQQLPKKISAKDGAMMARKP
jgi:hypothetical protein